MNRAGRIAALVGSILLAGGAAAMPAGAQAPPTATVVIVHGLRGFTADLYVDGKLLINTFQPERSTDPMPVPAGHHLVEIREAGAAPDAPPAVTADLDLAAGTRYEAVAHLDQKGAPTVTAFVDDVSPVPPGQARAVVRQAAAAPPIDVRFGTMPTALALGNGAEAATVVPASPYEVTVSATGNPAPLAPPQDVTFPEGTATFLYLIGSAEGQTLDWLAVQATGLQSAPTKVPTGDGSVTQAESGSDGATGRKAAGLGAVTLFFAIATIRRLRRVA
jgi:hypothetical protein